ncbi:MAG: heavy-metal-associated domain-containing protein [Chloroflexi bacterium]|nr:heavy-metal-associated domain-containing protein [Chloroflexota bacterium]
MEKITLTVPAMFADHHVINVKRLLSPLSGVETVIASSAFKTVVIEFDGSKTSQAVLVQALTDAGYAPGPEEFVARTPDYTPDPAWEKLGVRAVTTNPVDNQLSGEFRKY